MIAVMLPFAVTAVGLWIWWLQAGSPMEWEKGRRKARQQYIRAQSLYDETKVTAAETYYLNRRGTELFCRRWYPSDGNVKAVVFMCHGYGSMCWYLAEDVAVRLASAGYLVYAIDLEGHGCSAGLHGYIPRFDSLVEDLVEFMDGVHGISELSSLPLFLYGLSMGGAVVIKAHWMRPDLYSGIILNAPMVRIAPHLMPPKFVVRVARLLRGLIPKVKLLPSRNIYTIYARDPTLRDSMCKNSVLYHSWPRVATALTLHDACNEVCDKMEEVTLPLLLLHGKYDIVTDPKSSQELYERAGSTDKKLHLYDAWHALTAGEAQEIVEQVFTDMITWLNERSGKDGVNIKDLPSPLLFPPFTQPVNHTAISVVSPLIV